MSAYNQHHPRGPVFALRPVVAGLASGRTDALAPGFRRPALNAVLLAFPSSQETHQCLPSICAMSACCRRILCSRTSPW